MIRWQGCIYHPLHRSPRQHVLQRTVSTRAAHTAFQAPPTQLLQRIQTVNEQWLRADTSQPLTYTSDTSSTCKVTFIGVVPYAPLQAEFVSEIIQQTKPEAILIDQPQTGTSNPAVAYPDWIQVLLTQQSSSASREQLLKLLQRAQIQAKIGKDILDPFETFGFYSGTDLVKCSPHIALILSAMGYLPGQEYVSAVQAAQQLSSQIVCIDAPLKLQEVWVTKLVKEFSVTEPSLAYQLNKAFEANAAACHEAAFDWDRSIGQWAMSQQDPDLLMAAYKASKAGAAALLAPKELQPALQRSAQLQPLKFRHFALRELHMARQILDACMRLADGYSATIRRLAIDHRDDDADDATSSADDPNTIDITAMSQPSSREMQWSSPTSKQGQEHHVVAVIARHHIPGIRALWEDPGSALWQGQVTREFSPSKVEVLSDPDVEHGGSRPVGQVAKSLDRLGELLGGSSSSSGGGSQSW